MLPGQDARPIVQMLEANPRLGEELRQAPKFTDQGREAATITVWVK